jgi:hypothetical protein
MPDVLVGTKPAKPLNEADYISYNTMFDTILTRLVQGYDCTYVVYHGELMEVKYFPQLDIFSVISVGDFKTF